MRQMSKKWPWKGKCLSMFSMHDYKVNSFYRHFSPGSQDLDTTVKISKATVKSSWNCLNNCVSRLTFYTVN